MITGLRWVLKCLWEAGPTQPGSWRTSRSNCPLPLQAGMPRTLSTSDMVTPGSLGPPPTEPTDGEQAGQPLLDGPPSSASLDTLIQHLVPTADYYPEVGDLPSGEIGSRHGEDSKAGASQAWGVGCSGLGGTSSHTLVSTSCLSPMSP